MNRLLLLLLQVIDPALLSATMSATAFAPLRRILPRAFLKAPSIISPARFYSTSPLAMAASAADMKSALPSSSSFVGTNVDLAMEALANADAVCFDVDSTVIAEEGIDVLADYLGKGEAVAALTRKAMEGSTKFQDALQKRLELLQPSEEQIMNCLIDRPLQLTPGVESLVEALIEAKIDVYLVSGGFRIMIEPIAKTLCVAKSNIYANTILFDKDGNYIGFDANEPTSADMGKPKALQMIKEKNGYETMVMVGDGATDAQAKPPADAFIGFGGVVVREPVKEKACWFVTDFADMEQIVRQFGKAHSKE
jgi:phosphoserine phosphatase